MSAYRKLLLKSQWYRTSGVNYRGFHCKGIQNFWRLIIFPGQTTFINTSACTILNWNFVLSTKISENNHLYGISCAVISSYFCHKVLTVLIVINVNFNCNICLIVSKLHKGETYLFKFLPIISTFIDIKKLFNCQMNSQTNHK